MEGLGKVVQAAFFSLGSLFAIMLPLITLIAVLTNSPALAAVWVLALLILTVVIVGILILSARLTDGVNPRSYIRDVLLPCLFGQTIRLSYLATTRFTLPRRGILPGGAAFRHLLDDELARALDQENVRKKLLDACSDDAVIWTLHRINRFETVPWPDDDGRHLLKLQTERVQNESFAHDCRLYMEHKLTKSRSARIAFAQTCLEVSETQKTIARPPRTD